ncbi:MAG: hypothetical protein ABH829_05040 [archaeon]
MRALVPLFPCSSRAEKAAEKAKSNADEVVLAYLLPAKYAKVFSFTKFLFYGLCGNYALNYLEEKMPPAKVKKIMLYGDQKAEILRAFKREKCDVVIAEAWQQKEYNILREVSTEVPTITIFRRGSFSYAQGSATPAVSREVKGFGKEPLDEILWSLYSKDNLTAKKPQPEPPVMPDDWVRAFKTGEFLSIFFRTGLIFEKDMLDSLLEREPEQDTYDLLKKLAHRMYVLLKFKSPPEPNLLEWWAETSALPDDHGACASSLLEKMERIGHLSNHERVFLASYLGCLRGVNSKSILRLFEHNLIDHEPKISAFNTYQILGLFSGKPYVVSDNYARAHGICKGCEREGQPCRIQMLYLKWLEKERRHAREKA